MNTNRHQSSLVGTTSTASLINPFPAAESGNISDAVERVPTKGTRCCRNAGPRVSRPAARVDGESSEVENHETHQTHEIRTDATPSPFSCLSCLSWSTTSSRFIKSKLLILLTLHLGLAALVAQPVITNQPQNQTAIAGTTAMFTVGATGTPPLSYQWRSHANATTFTNIPFGTEATLVLTNVQPTSRRFASVVTDAGGLSTTSSPLAQLTVLTLPGFSLQPSNQSVSLGVNVRFLAAVTNIHPPIRYQWQLAGTNLANQTNTTLNLTNVHLAHAGDYNVTATDTIGSVTSLEAHLEVDPTFTKITTGQIVNDGGFGFGSAWGDYNNDGFIDLFVCNVPLGSGNQQNFLYRNTGNGAFDRITSGSLVNEGNAGLWAVGAAWGDYDNDGNLDLYVTGASDVSTVGPNRLYHNDGNGTFTKITTGLLVTQQLKSHAGVWADFDNDGLIDLFVSNFRSDSTVPAKDNYLYRNTGDGTFERIALGTKSLANGDSWTVAAADFNNDGWMDSFVPQGAFLGKENNLLYVNNRNGSFTIQTNTIIFTNTANSVACAWGDYDNDGFLDLFVSNILGQKSFLYHNNGNGTFTLITNSPIALDGGWSLGCAWGDYDNDGWLDLFVANRGPFDPITLNSIASGDNFLYHNNGDGTFTRITAGSLVNDGGYSTGCAWGDYDNDGFLDLFVSNGWLTKSDNNFLYQNNGNSNYWINFRLVGTASNRSAIGAKVRVKATVGGNVIWQLRELSGGSNYGSQNDLRANFGLGDATNADTVRIEWPSGTVQELHNITAKQFLTLTEPPRLLASKTNGTPQFTLLGGRGFQYQIETSTNLPDWSPLGPLTITNQNGTAPIPDTNAQGSRRFYRAVRP